MSAEQPNFFDIGESLFQKAAFEVALSVWRGEREQDNEIFTEQSLCVALQELGMSPAEADHITFVSKLEAMSQQLGD